MSAYFLPGSEPLSLLLKEITWSPPRVIVMRTGQLCDAMPHHHNVCWYHCLRALPISALHFHHLLGTEFHHSRHSCSLPPSLLLSLPPPPPPPLRLQPSLSRQLCYYCLCFFSPPLFLFSLSLGIIFYNKYLFYFISHPDIILLEDTKVALEGGRCLVNKKLGLTDCFGFAGLRVPFTWGI